ncbi:hypothetical protein LEP1GSC125_3047 [Leptospira mayottensis 200901122]|uniref:Uncharacterized protein n=1 Tax=Leptospira mayottensis 200901122 TaxID=1193010 RepID=A0AA87SWE5_9LEPT|nr:hypothetical protein LEP1GSC125_3047 [Leptospira mayottensis 200901122]
MLQIFFGENNEIERFYRRLTLVVNLVKAERKVRFIPMNLEDTEY